MGGVDPALLASMKNDWNERARENARHYIVNYKTDWTDRDFYDSGKTSFEQYIANDLYNICQGRDPKEMRVLEIGCGSGRVSRALADFFGEVHAVDVSSEMISIARVELASYSNLFFYVNNGVDLQPVRHLSFDFAFSCCVFHHVPDIRIIESYWREVKNVLRPGALFKFEVQGDMRLAGGEVQNDSWFGAPVSAKDAVLMAERAGLEVRHMHGGGTERFWLWLNRPLA